MLSRCDSTDQQLTCLTELGRFSREQSPLTTTRPGSPSRFDSSTFTISYSISIRYQILMALPPSESSDTPASPMVNPTSALLQGLIKEQRASRGSSRRAVSEVADDIATATPPSTQSQEDSQSEKQRKVNSALSAGLRQPREMGFREMDQVSTEKEFAITDYLTISYSTSRKSISSTSTSNWRFSTVPSRLLLWRRS